MQINSLLLRAFVLVEDIKCRQYSGQIRMVSVMTIIMEKKHRVEIITGLLC